MTSTIVHLNGRPATREQLTPLAFAGFAHFTAIQVRRRAVRGLDLHLTRLREASRTLFGVVLDDDLVVDRLRVAIAAGPADASVSCFVFPRSGEFHAPAAADDLEVMVRVDAAARPPAGPLRLALMHHQRHLPQVKHVGEVAKTQLLRQAVRQGYDDAAFVDPGGLVSEATIWNLAFFDGESVVWPAAPMLTGVTMQILQRQLRALDLPQRSAPIRQDRLDGLAAVVMNSWTPAIGVAAMGRHRLRAAAELVSVLSAAYEREPWQPLA